MVESWGDNSEELGIHSRIYTIYSYFSACLYLACTVPPFIFPNFVRTVTNVNKSIHFVSSLWRLL